MANEVATTQKPREKISGIYIIFHKLTGAAYVGQSVDVLRRFAEHKAPHPNGAKDLHDDMKRNGLHWYEFLLLEECKPSILDEREMYYIELLKPEYNKDKGGKGSLGHIVSSESRAILSKKTKEQWALMDEQTRNKMLNNLEPRKKGHVVSEETRRKISLNRSGIPRKAESNNRYKETMRIKKANGYVQTNQGHKKQIICTTTGEVFDSVKDAGENFGIRPSCISSVLKGKQRTTHGLHFIYKEKKNGNNK